MNYCVIYQIKKKTSSPLPGDPAAYSRIVIRAEHAIPPVERYAEIHFGTLVMEHMMLPASTQPTKRFLPSMMNAVVRYEIEQIPKLQTNESAEADRDSTKPRKRSQQGKMNRDRDPRRGRVVRARP